MQVPSPEAGFSFARRAPWGPTLVGVLAALAYLPLLSSALGLSGSSVDVLLFRPGELPPFLVLAVAAWMLWRRLPQLQRAQASPAAVAASLLAALGTALYVWALLTRATTLLLPSLAANGLALAAGMRGRAGLRAALLPALVLLLGLPVPVPLREEIVWQLQLWTTAGAVWLLRGLGAALVHGGVVVRTAEHSFHVIDGCSGYAGIQILVLVSLIVRELVAEGGWRTWLLVLLAPVLGLGLNIVRIAAVVASSNPEALAGVEGDHTAHGVAVLAAGSAILYLGGRALPRSKGPTASPSSSRPSRPGAPAATAWLLPAGWLAGLGLLFAMLPPFPVEAPAGRPHLSFPESGAGWSSETLRGDPFFIGSGLTPDQMLHRRYERIEPSPSAFRVVELFVGSESRSTPSSNRLLSSKLKRPGPDWTVEEERRIRLWLLERSADRTIAGRPHQKTRAVVYRWRLGDRGLFWESLWDLLAFDASSFRRAEHRRVVQLIAFAPNGGEQAIDGARRRLQRFIEDFQAELAAL